MADDRLRKLVLMLSSDQPGEVAAAAKAIDRVLKVRGQDWNWLAAKLADDEAPQVRPAAAAEPRRRREPPPEAPRYTEPEPQPWGKPATSRSAGLRWFVFEWGMWLSGFSGRGKQITAAGGTLMLAGIFAAAIPVGVYGDSRIIVLLVLIAFAVVFAWAIVNNVIFWWREAVMAAHAIQRWFSRPRA
jgi:hypothetical protein